MTQWQKTKVGDFLFERKEKYQPNDEKIAGLSRINKIDFSGNFHISQKPSNTKMILICPDDLVISGINVAKGAMGIYRADKNIVATIHYSSYTFDEKKINVSYFKRFLKSAEFVKLLQEQVKGGIKTEIKPKHLLPLEINLPTIKEQKIIVKKLKDIETEENDLKQEITQQQTLLKKLRQQILQEAIEGKLTQDWRAENPNTEPASELLKRIQTEKQQLIKDKKIKAQKSLPEISEDEKPFKLSDSWVWCRLGEIMQLNPRNKLKDNLKVSFIPMRLILDGFRNKHSSEIKEWRSIKNGFTHFSENDIAVSKITPCFQNRKSTVLKNLLNKHGAGTTELYIFRSYGKMVIPEYILFMIKTDNFINEGVATYKGTVGQQRVQKTFIQNYIVSLPPLAEQKAIVAKVEKLLSICDKLQTQIAHNQNHAEQLMQAVLKEAFTQSPQSIELQKPEEKAFLKRKIMAAYIINQSLEDKNFGDVKFEKMLYLSDCLLQRDFNQHYYQKVAGPYDNKFTYAFFNQVQKAKWFKKQKHGTVNRIMADKNVAKSQNTYNYFSKEELNKVDGIIKLFKKTNYEKPEVVATLYAVWNNRIINRQPIDDELLKADFLAWDKKKIKYQERIFDALSWMRKENIVPNGWGKLINKPK